MTILDSRLTTVENHEMWSKRLKLCLAVNNYSKDDSITPAVAQVFAAFNMAAANDRVDAEVPTEAWEEMMSYYESEPDNNGKTRMVLVMGIEELEEAINRTSETIKANGMIIDDVTRWCLRFFNFKASRAIILGLPYIQIRQDIHTRIEQYTRLFV